MKFSKRPQPMSFGDSPSVREDAAVLPTDNFDAVGFQPLDAATLERPVTIHEVRSLAKPSDHPLGLSGLESEPRPPPAWPIWVVAVLVAGLWALAPIAFAVGYRNNVAPLQSQPFALLVFSLLAVGPAAFVLGAAYMIRQGQKLAFEARRAKAMAQDMLAPSLIAAARSGDVARAIRDEITRAGTAADDARETLAALRESLAFETDKLTGATAQSLRTARELADTLGRERSEMSGLAQTLDTQSERVSDNIVHQARIVREAAGLAERHDAAADCARHGRACQRCGARRADLGRARGPDAGA